MILRIFSRQPHFTRLELTVLFLDMLNKMEDLKVVLEFVLRMQTQLLLWLNKDQITLKSVCDSLYPS